MRGSRTETPVVAFEWVRQADDALVAQVGELFNSSLQLDDMIGFPGPIRDIERSPYLAALKHDVNAGRRQLLLGRTPDLRVVAMVVLAHNGLPNCRHLADVSKCVIHPDCRGRGVLAAGLRELLVHCRAEAIEVLTLDVRSGTRAEALWRALGFRPYGELPDYARVDGRTYAGLYLWAPVETLARADTAVSAVVPPLDGSDSLSREIPETSG